MAGEGPVQDEDGQAGDDDVSGSDHGHSTQPADNDGAADNQTGSGDSSVRLSAADADEKRASRRSMWTPHTNDGTQAGDADTTPGSAADQWLGVRAEAVKPRLLLRHVVIRNRVPAYRIHACGESQRTGLPPLGIGKNVPRS